MKFNNNVTKSTEIKQRILGRRLATPLSSEAIKNVSGAGNECWSQYPVEAYNGQIIMVCDAQLV